MPDATYTNTVGFAPEVADLANDVVSKSRAVIQTPYQNYMRDRIAQFTPLQLQSFQNASKLGPASQSLNAATGLESLAKRAGQLNYAGSNYGNAFKAPTNLDYNAAQANAAQFVAPQNVASRDIVGAQTNYQPNLQNYQMGPAEQVQTQNFGQPALNEYMNPYMQSVVDVQKREAQRASTMQAQQDQARAAQSGAFGGTRDALIRAERERNMGTQLNDIQSQGSNLAFQQAQQQFNADQARNMAAQQANQQAGLTVGQQNLAAKLGVQQLGTQTGAQMALANLSNQQQALGMNQQAALQAALANQQVGYNTNLQNAQFQQGTNLSNQAALNAQRQFGAGQNLTAAQTAAQYGQSANQLNEQSRQYGAGLGLQGMQAGMVGYGDLANAGQNIYNQQSNALGIQNAFGGQQQQQVQNVLGQQYQDWIDQKNYPYKQLQWGMEMARGAPTSNLGTNMYSSPPSALSQVAGIGATAYGLFGGSNPVVKAKGGLVELALSKM